MDRQKLYETMQSRFDGEELKILCYFLGINYGYLPGEGQRGKVRSLIELCEREDRLGELIAKCAELRPRVDWTNFTVQEGTVPAKQVHGYSGEWSIMTKFKRWRGFQLEGENKVWFEGNASMQLSANGQRGFGIQRGTLNVSIGGYTAVYSIFNWIYKLNATGDGVLHLDGKVVVRELVDEVGEPGDPRFREDLAESEFTQKLEPVKGNPGHLQGTHVNWKEGDVYQAATEFYQQLDS